MKKFSKIMLVALGIILIRSSNVPNYCINIIVGTLGALCIMLSTSY